MDMITKAALRAGFSGGKTMNLNDFRGGDRFSKLFQKQKTIFGDRRRRVWRSRHRDDRGIVR